MYGGNKTYGRKKYRKANKKLRISPYKAGYLAGLKAGKYRSRTRKFAKKRW